MQEGIPPLLTGSEMGFGAGMGLSKKKMQMNLFWKVNLEKEQGAYHHVSAINQPPYHRERFVLMTKYFHSVTLEKDKCRGCTNCIKHCPTEAIRKEWQGNDY